MKISIGKFCKLFKFRTLSLNNNISKSNSIQTQRVDLLENLFGNYFNSTRI